MFFIGGGGNSSSSVLSSVVDSLATDENSFDFSAASGSSFVNVVDVSLVANNPSVAPLLPGSRRSLQVRT